MASILVTGVSGFIGARLARRLQGRHEVVGLSRSRPAEVDAFVQGAFHDPGALERLDAHRIDALVHLAAQTGLCADEDALAANVAGTSRLLRYLMGRGCRKFVLASSIAAVGCLGESFDPDQAPIPARHPGRAADAYGLSKWLMEEFTRGLARREPDVDVTNLRFGGVCDEAMWAPGPMHAGDLADRPWVVLARVMAGDVLDAIEAALAIPGRGERTCNIVGPDSACDDPVADVLRAWDAERAARLDLSHYEQPGHEHDALYSMTEARAELGFTPTRTVRPERLRATREQRSG